MSTKPIKQYATLTDEAGVEAMTVATGGAVTVGPSTAGNIQHKVSGSIGARFGAGIYNIGGQEAIETIELSANGSATDALTITTAFGVGYQIVVSAMAAGNSAVLFATFASATITELADPGAIIPGTFTVTKAANSYQFKIENATAAAILLGVQVIGARVESAVLGT
jgi:hypothetical protein